MENHEYKRFNVDKKYVSYKEHSSVFSDYNKYHIEMPEQSQYKGHHIELPIYYCDVDSECKSLYCITLKDNYICELVKTDREKGKRYVRPKLSVKELFTELEKAHDDIKGKLCLANVPIYWGKGVLKEYSLEVGYCDDSWFHVLDRKGENVMQKKLLNAFRLAIVGEIEKVDIVRLNDYKQWKRNFSRDVAVFDCHIEKFEDNIKYSKLPKTDKIENAEATLLRVYKEEKEMLVSMCLLEKSNYKDFIGAEKQTLNMEKVERAKKEKNTVQER